MKIKIWNKTYLIAIFLTHEKTHKGIPLRKESKMWEASSGWSFHNKYLKFY